MKLILSCIKSSEGLPTNFEYVDTVDNPHHLILNPVTNERDMTVMQFLTYLRDNPDARKAAGFLEPSNLPGVASNATKWNVMVEQANHPQAETEIQKLGLTHG